MTLNLASVVRTSAAAHPKKAALILGDTTLSYEELHAAVQRFAGALRGLGIKKGQHVALMLPNVPHFTIATVEGKASGRRKPGRPDSAGGRTTRPPAGRAAETTGPAPSRRTAHHVAHVR